MLEARTRLKGILRRYRGWAYLLGLRPVELVEAEYLVRDLGLRPDDYYEFLEEVEDIFKIGGRANDQLVGMPDASIGDLLQIIERQQWPADWLLSNRKQQ